MRPSLALLLTMGTASLADFTFDELWSLQNTLWENFLYPANVQQINATDTSVFAEDVLLIPQSTPKYVRKLTLIPMKRSKAAST